MDNMMAEQKILYIDHSAKTSGAQKCLLALMENLDRSRFRPVVVCPPSSLLAGRARELGIAAYPFDFIWLGRRPLVAIKALPSIVRFIWLIRAVSKKERPVVMHTNTAVAAVYGGIASRVLGLPWVCHGRDILKPGIHSILFRKMVSAFADSIVCVSEATSKGYMGRAVTIYDGVDAGAFSAVAAGGAVRAELGIQSSSPIIGMIGQVAKWKGHEVLVDAAPAIIESFPDVSFVIAGESIYGDGAGESLSQKIEAMDLRDRFTFTGYREDVASLLSTVDVYIHPSIHPDPLPQALLEAMAAGKAVVASSIGGIPEMITHGVDGLLFAPGDSGKLAGAVISVLRDRSFARRMGEEARKKVSEKFSLSEHVRAIEREYEIIVSVKPRPS